MRDDFITAIQQHQSAFSLQLSEEAVDRLAGYFVLVQEHNPLMHLVAPCSPEEFAVRHILESLTLLEHFPRGANFADVGTGAGLPSIPCLLVRDDLKATLLESKEKKARFLKSTVERLNLEGRANVFDRQFEEAELGSAQFVACRALDKFTEKLPRLIKWSKKRQLLLFGGNNLAEALQKQRVKFVQKLMPLSEQRFLFIVDSKNG